MDNDALVSALLRYQSWEAERTKIRRELNGDDTANLLMSVLYYGPDAAKLMGGCNAAIFYDAARRIEELEKKSG